MSSLIRASHWVLAVALSAQSNVVCAQTATSAVAIPFKPEAMSDSPGLVQWLGVVLGCLILLAVLVVLLRSQKLSILTWGGGRAGSFSVLEQTSLNATTRLVAVRYQDRRLLLAVGPSFVNCLRDEPADEAPPAAPAEDKA